MNITADPAPGLESDDLPALHKNADKSSLDGQSTYLLWTRARLVLVVVAAVTGLFDVTTKINGTKLDALALVAVICFLLALGAEIYLLTSKPDQIWYYGRAIAESVKTLAWRYAMCGQPFASAADQAADSLLLAKLTELVKESPVASDLAPQPGQQITPKMKSLRTADFSARKAAYLTGRVDDQIKWYADKARYNHRRANFWRIMMIILEIAGVVFAVLLLVRVLHVSADGVIAAMIAGAGAWLEVRQFEGLASAYSLTATELSLARDDGEAITAAERWPEYVAETEEAISREHTMWLVRRVGPRLGRK